MLSQLKQQWLKYEDGFDNPISKLKIKLKIGSMEKCKRMQREAEFWQS